MAVDGAPSLEAFLARYPDEAACLDRLWRLRMSADGEWAPCPSCKVGRRFRSDVRRRSYSCRTCGYHLHPTADTILYRSTTPLRQWFRAVYLMAATGGEISGRQLERELGVTYKTAWRMSSLIRTQLSRNGALRTDDAEQPLAVAERWLRAIAGAPRSTSAAPGAPVWGPGEIFTFAGDGTPGYGGDGGPAPGAQLAGPCGLAVDGAGNVFIADTDNHVIRKVDGLGVISTLAGTGVAGYSGDGGPATRSRLNHPAGIAVDESGDLLVADTDNHVVRRIDGRGTISTVAGDGRAGFAGDGGPARRARFHWVYAVLPVAGGFLVSDHRNHRIRKVDAAGIVTTIAGNGSDIPSGDGGPAIDAGVPYPAGLSVGRDGVLYVPQSWPTSHAKQRRTGTPCCCVRRIDPTGIITLFAGSASPLSDGDGGFAVSASLDAPTDVAVDESGAVLISDWGNHRVRRVDASGFIGTVVGTGRKGFAGNGGPATSAQLSGPFGVALTASGDLLVADTGNHRIRRVVAPLPDRRGLRGASSSPMVAWTAGRPRNLRNRH